MGFYRKSRPRPFRDIVFIACPPSTMTIPPVGIGSIAEYLRQLGYEAPIIDLNIRMYKEANEREKEAWDLDKKNHWLQEQTLAKLLKRFDRQIEDAIDEALGYERYIIGFTVLHSREELTSVIIDRIKERDPGRLVVVGGPSLAQGKMRRSYTHQCQYDFAVVGEGELAMEQVLGRLRNGTGDDLMEVPGVIHRMPAYTQYVAPHPPIAPLDQLPFPRYRDLDPADYPLHDPFPVVWSRGCPGRCAFCESSRIWGTIRQRSPEHIHEELRYVTRHFEVTHISPFDPIINGSPAALLKVADLITRKGPEITWEGNFMATTKMSGEIYQTLHESGCLRVYYGLESGSPAILRKMKKPFSLQTAVNNITWAHEAGLEVFVNIITGFPGEGEKEFEETLAFLREHHEKITGIDFITECQIPEETDLYFHPEKYGIHFEKDFLGFRWESTDGENNYQVRQDRSRIVEEEAVSLGIKTNPSTTLTDGQILEDDLLTSEMED